MSQNVGIKNQDTMCMKHYPCHSHLIISCHETNNGLTKVAVSLEHHIKHVNYVDVSSTGDEMTINYYQQQNVKHSY